MIRKRVDKDNISIMNIWNLASRQAHPFLDNEFVEKAKHDLNTIYIPNTETWVYDQDNAIVGFISMIENEIGGIFVLPINQSNGIGTKLIEFIKQFHDVLELEVFEKNKIGRSFYKKLGFIQTGKYYHKESKNEVLKLHFKIK